MGRISKFLMTDPLYKNLSVSIDDWEEFLGLEKNELKIEVYCAECKCNRVFTLAEKRILSIKSDKDATPLKRMAIYRNDEIDTPLTKEKKTIMISQHFDDFIQEGGMLSLLFCCTFNPSHHVYFDLLVTDSSFKKIGQYPTIADFDSGNLKVYKKQLGKYHQELTKAIRLYSNDIGVGSYVYLRRILEFLVEEAHKRAVLDKCWDDTYYEKDEKGRNRTVVEKIKSLKGFLPATLVDNSPIYGIVSKGVHFLSEEECMKYFPVLRSGIELILNSELERISREEKESAFSKALNDINSHL